MKNNFQFLIYRSAEEDISVDAFIKDDTIWLTQKGMEQFASSINEFLSFRRYDVLPDKRKVTNRKAREKAEAEYAMFNPTQKIVSDFDKAVKKLKPE